MAPHSSVLAWRISENPWWAAIYGFAQSWTRLKQLSSSSSTSIKDTNQKAPVKQVVSRSEMMLGEGVVSLPVWELGAGGGLM